MDSEDWGHEDCEVCNEARQRKWNPIHYNAIAKEIREMFPAAFDREHDVQIKRGTLVNFALRMAKRFKDDNPEFDALKWLDQCSPDVDRYPFSELWVWYLSKRFSGLWED